MREGAGLRSSASTGAGPGSTWGGAPSSRRGSAAAGLAFYLVARAAGFNLTVVPESLPEVWWKFPVLILSAIQNSVRGGGDRRRVSAAQARAVGLDPDGRAHGQFGAPRLVPPLPGHRRLHRQHGHGRGLRAALPALGQGRAAGRGPCAARHRRLRRIRTAGGKVDWLPTP